MSDKAPARKPRKAVRRTRCRWVAQADADYVRYHDTQWGTPGAPGPDAF